MITDFRRDSQEDWVAILACGTGIIEPGIAHHVAPRGEVMFHVELLRIG